VTTPTGESIEASITLEDGGGAMLSDPRTGAYYRPLAAGSYRVSASALGFSSVSESLDVSEGEVLDWNPVLTPIVSIDIESFGVLSNATMSDAKDNAFIDSENLASMLGAGATLELYRVGVSDTYQVPLTIAGSRVYLELNNLKRVLREQRGFWDLLVKDADGRVAHRFAQAVFLVDAVLLDDGASSYSLEKIEPGRYLFQGPAQQPGTELSLMGPGLRQSLPLRRMTYEPGYFRFELGAEDLAVGDWYVRLSQAGAFNRIPWLVRNDANELSLIEVSKVLEELGRDAVDPAGGCTCQSSQPMGWLVVLALGLRLLRRRQAYLFHKAG
jgi:MYXO-CTERM domain-containing protein